MIVSGRKRCRIDMAKQETQLKAVLTLVDQVSPALKGLKKELRIAAREGRGLFQQIGDAAQLAAKGVAVLSAAGGTTWYATLAAADASVALETFSKQIGISVERLQAWQTVAVSSGMQAEEFSEALRDMNIELSDAATGGKDELAQLLKRVGISARDSSGNIRNANEVFLEFADAVARQTDPMIQYRMAILAFGEDTGARILPVLRQGSEAFRENEEAMKAAGTAITEQQIGRLKNFRNQWNLLKQSFSSVSTGVLSELAPSFAKLAEKVREILERIRPLLNITLEKLTQQFANFVDQIPWEDIFRKIDAFVSGGEKFKQEFGLIGQALGLIFEHLGTAITVYLGVKTGTELWNFSKALISVAKAAPVLIKSLIPLVSAASPFVLLGTVVAAAAFGIIENWDKIKNAVLPIIESIANGIQWLIDLIRSAGDFIQSKIDSMIPDFLKSKPEIRVAFENATHQIGLDEQPVTGSNAAQEQRSAQMFYSTEGFSIPEANNVRSLAPSVIDNRMSGRVDVNFNNAPQELSIQKASGSNGVDVNARIRRSETGRGPYAPTFVGDF